ncbi:MAG: T9SS type A sorting domain-containing protein [Bacteroidetes bacterium]|nr:T9SS type A sorting domain-containing protein [Bacteroidota bacterium]
MILYFVYRWLSKSLIAGGIFKTNVATGNSGWQQATINMTYVSALTPDTMWVLVSSSSLDKNPKAGSILWLDDASVTLPTGVNEFVSTENTIEIFPNPSNGIFTIRTQTANNEEQYLKCIIYLEQNSLIRKSKRSAYTIDLSNQSKGFYFVKVYQGEKCTTPKNCGSVEV